MVINRDGAWWCRGGGNSDDDNWWWWYTYWTTKHHFCISAVIEWIIYQLSPVHTSNNIEPTLLNDTSRTILSTKSNVASTLLPFLATMLPFWQQCRTKFRPFDKVQTFDKVDEFVERAKFYDKLVRHWCLLLQHCCCCGRGFKPRPH